MASPSPSGVGFAALCDTEPLRSHDLYKKGGLFDEFLQLPAAQLSWGGVVSVLSSLIQSHGQCLSKLSRIEDAVLDMRESWDERAPPSSSSLQQGQAGVLDSAVKRIQRTDEAVQKLYAVLQIEVKDLDSALHQAEAEGVNGHSKVKYLHCLPAFSTLIEDIRDVLVPVGDGGSAGGTPQQQQQQQQQQTQRLPASPGPELKAGAKSYSGFPVSAGQPAHPPANGAAQGHPGGRPMVGLEIIDAVPGSADPLSSSGVRVFAVRPEGPAAQGGVMNGDCIISMNDMPVKTRADLKQVMASCRPGDAVKVELLRQGIPEPFIVHIRLGIVPGSMQQIPYGVSAQLTPQTSLSATAGRSTPRGRYN
ncbi:hypothetical protein DIPPA_24237 [Diplonema papillatum]|nr:hypothetical protein DIPPA_24237 [Diplonema papillatum]